MENKLIQKNKKEFKGKISLIKIENFYGLTIIEKDPLTNLLKDFEEIENLLDLNLCRETNYIYFSKEKIHKILYDAEELIDIKFDKTKNDLAYNFYLNLLINDNTTITNYSYSLDFINELNNEKKLKEETELYKSIFYAKCIIDLINNFKQLDDYDDENEDKLNIIKGDNEKYIKEKINIFNDIININEKDFKSNKMDEIFSDIINSLIINEKNKDYEFICDIINQLELENIDITKNIFEQMKKILDKENNKIQKYIIIKKEDLFKEIKINFYYILLKYIFKNSIYIYNIPLLLDTRKIILKIIKTDELLCNNLSDSNKIKFEYIITTMADSKYYTNIKLKEILKYYKEFYFETKKDEIKNIEDIINNNKKGYEKYLPEYDEAKKMNIRLPIIKYIIKSKYSKEIKNESQIKQIRELWDSIEILIKNKKIKKMFRSANKTFMDYINDKNNINILLKIFSQNQLDYFIGDQKYFENKSKETDNNTSISFQEKTETKSTVNESNVSLSQKESISKLSIANYFFEPIKPLNSANGEIIKNIINIDENINEPAIKISYKYKEIENILKTNKTNIIKFLFFNRFNIGKILFNEEKIININMLLEKGKENLNTCFYLDLLINDNKNIINYFYSLNFIREINNQAEKQDEKYKLLIKAKIIIDLIYYYKELYIYNEEKEKEELDNIIKKNKNIIEKNKSQLKEIGLNENIINEKKIDEIYTEIIIALIKFQNDFSFIMNQLDLENIILTQKMKDNIINFFNNNEQFLNNYKINTFQDFNNNKIIFYDNLFKFLLKNPINIYQIPFLLKTRKSIIKLIQKNYSELLNSSNISNSLSSLSFSSDIFLVQKFKYIIKMITDSEYYNKKFIKYYEQITSFNISHINRSNYDLNNSSRVDVKDVSEEDLNDSKILDKEADFQQNMIDYKQALKNCNILLFVEYNEQEQKCDFKKIIYDEEITSYEDFIKPFKNEENKTFPGDEFWNSLFSKYKKFIKFLENIKNLIIKSLKEKKIEQLKLKIELHIKDNGNNSFENIICKYYLLNPIFYDINKKDYIDENILNNEKYDRFNYFLSDIFKNIYGDIKSQESEDQALPYIPNLSSITKNSSNNYTSISQTINLIQIKYPKYKIIEYIGNIGSHKGSTFYIKEIEKGLFISGGSDDKVKIYFPNKSIQELEIKDSLGFFDYIEETKIIIFSKNNFYIRDYYSNASPTRQNIKDYEIVNIVYFGSKNIFICTEKDIILLTDFLNSIIETKKTTIYEKKKYFGGIKINDKNVAFVSNKLLLNGESQIIFYNTSSRKITQKDSLKGYSYTLSKNNLAIMSIPKKYSKNEDDKLLFCGCTKYNRDDKNGILLIHLEINKNKNILNIKKKFYNTKNFQVYCFCPLLSIKNIMFLDQNPKNSNIEDTEYIFVGGLDTNKSEGSIKLYRIIYNKNNKIKLEFISDVNTQKYIKLNSPNIFKGFKGAITCMTQSRENGNILISCLDGNIYSFSEPFIKNIDNMFKNDFLNDLI